MLAFGPVSVQLPANQEALIGKHFQIRYVWEHHRMTHSFPPFLDFSDWPSGSMAAARWCRLMYSYSKNVNVTKGVSIKSAFSVCLVLLPQLESHSSAGTAPTAPPRRATWRPTSSVSTASRLTTASTRIAASDAHTCPRGPPDCLRVSREIILHRGETRLAWHHSVGLDAVMATPDTDSYYCLASTRRSKYDWDEKKKKKN